MARTNGGIIGKSNKTSFGKNTQTVHTSSGTKTFQPGTRVIKTLIVAGGASGGSDQGGGGGAGGLRIIDSINLSTNSAPITIGAGGTAKNSGSNSNVVGICGTVLSTGGGAQGTPGGSGGGAYGNPGPGKGCGNAGSFSPPEGNNGGTGAIIPGCSQASGGGGGSGAVGGNSGGTSNAKSGGAGGAGTDTSPHFPGAPSCGVYAGGGGGGGGGPGTSGGAGGPGGGSAGTTCSTNGNNATANTGGGAGGSGNPPAPSAGNGGSGIVITRELNKASGVWNLKSQLRALQQGTWPANYTFDANYLVAAGGGGGGFGLAGGGGAGGYRATGFGPSPLRGTAMPFSSISGGTSYTITIGAGGAKGGGCADGSVGENSVFAGTSTITSAGGGFGAHAFRCGGNGGSGGGGGAGGAGAAASPACATTVVAGSGVPNTITGSDVTYAAGGTGNNCSNCSPRSDAANNTGNGGEGGGGGGGGNGGPGVVIIRVPGGVPLAVSPGTNTVASCVGSCNERVARFTVTGTLTVG